MFDKLATEEQRYEELMRLLGTSEVQSEPAEYRKYAKALAEVEPLVERFREYKQVVRNIAETEELVDAGDADMRDLAREELKSLIARREALVGEMKILLIPKDPNDEKNVMLEIRAGAGGDEAALFAAELFRMYSMFAERHGWRIEVMSSNDTGGGGLKEVIAMIEGRGVYSKLKYESGGHRVQRVPATEASGRIHTSAVTVAILPEPDEVEVTDLNPAELRVDTYRASGAGGQHVNKTESAIRITHLPTGLVVECQDERSQHKNRSRAMALMKAKLLAAEQEKRDSEIARNRKLQVGTGDRSERIRTYNFPQGRVTDHRINLTLYKLGDIMQGRIDELLEALQHEHQAEQLAEEEQRGAA